MRHVVEALAQRRHRQDEARQAGDQLGAQTAGAELAGIAGGGGDDANVDEARRGGAERADLAAFEEAEERGLHGGRRAVDAVEQQGAAGRALEQAGARRGVGDRGRVRVLDFGLARALAEPAEGEGATVGGSGPAEADTATGAVLGTPGYMAPEQERGGAVDARSDVYGLCVALYEALTLERYDEALAAHRRAHDIRVRVFGPDHATVAQSLTNLSALGRKRGDLDEAIAHADRAATIYRTLHGPHHIKTLQARLNLAEARCASARPAAGLALLVEDRPRIAAATGGATLARAAADIERSCMRAARR